MADILGLSKGPPSDFPLWHVLFKCCESTFKTKSTFIFNKIFFERGSHG